MKVNRRLLDAGREMYGTCKDRYVSKEEFRRAVITQYELYETRIGAAKALAGMASITCFGLAGMIVSGDIGERLAATVLGASIPALFTGIYFSSRYVNIFDDYDSY